MFAQFLSALHVGSPQGDSHTRAVKLPPSLSERSTQKADTGEASAHTGEREVEEVEDARLRALLGGASAGLPLPLLEHWLRQRQWEESRDSALSTTGS